MYKKHMNKGTVLVIIILLIGVTFAPSIHADFSKGRELVKITTEICGLDRIRPHTVMLTQEELMEFDNLIETVKERLDNAETNEETLQIINQAIEELNHMGLLPDGITMKQVQRLVSGQYQNPRVIGLLEKIHNRKLGTFDDDENYKCLIVGKTSVTLIIGFLAAILLMLAGPIGAIIGLYLHQLLPFGFINWFYFSQNVDNPSQGWVFTIGLNGIKRWSGSLRGTIPTNETPAVEGFIGIKLARGYIEYYGIPWFETFFYLGFASRVGIEEIG